MTFVQKLDVAVAKNNSLLCINLDPTSDDLLEFNKKIINETYDLVCCYKPNSAFYEAQGAEGIEKLKETVEHIRKVNPELPVILDGKRGDIGNTNMGYIQFAFNYVGADALTLHPYMGDESLQPFFEKIEKGFFILCKNSNPGSGEFQDLMIDGKRLFINVAERVSKNWNKNNNVMLVVGATYPDELKQVRQIVGDMTILVPGIGAQGGDLEQTLKAGLTSNKKGLIISVGRSIINATDVRGEAEKVRDEINKYRQ